MSRKLVAMATGSRGELLHRVKEEEEMVNVRVPLVTMTTIPRGKLYNMLRKNKKKKRNTSQAASSTSSAPSLYSDNRKWEHFKC